MAIFYSYEKYTVKPLPGNQKWAVVSIECCASSMRKYSHYCFKWLAVMDPAKDKCGDTVMCLKYFIR